FTFSGLDANEPYLFKVKAYNSSASSKYSNYRGAYQTDFIAPIANSAKNIEKNSFLAQWNDVGTSYYILLVSTDPDLLENVDTINAIGIERQIDGLLAGGVYYYAVIAGNQEERSEMSNVIPVHLNLDEPDNVVFGNLSYNGFRLSWDSVYGASEYKVYLYHFMDAYTHGPPSIVPGYENGVITSNSWLEFNDLIANHSYYYSVQAINNNVSSSHNINPTEIRTLLSSPEALNATDVCENSFFANWSKVNGAQFYYLDVALDSGFTNILPQYDNFLLNSVGHKIKGLLPSTKYYYRVRASVNVDERISSYSNVVLADTGLETPSGLQLTDIGPTGFSVSWERINSVDVYGLSLYTVNNGDHSVLTDYEDVSTSDTTFTVEDLPEKNYALRVRSETGGNLSSWSNFLYIELPTSPIYVNNSLVDIGDGKSWSTAFNSLQVALDTADTGDQVWVKSGNYNVSDESVDYFEVKPGVMVYGGFSGSEARLSQRSQYGKGEMFETSLDGDRSNYIFPTLIIRSGSHASLIDGFSIVNGQNQDGCGGILVDANGLGNATLSTIENCNFYDNYGSNSNSFQGAARIKKCIFEPHSTSIASAMFAVNSTINDCIFVGDSLNETRIKFKNSTVSNSEFRNYSGSIEFDSTSVFYSTFQGNSYNSNTIDGLIVATLNSSLNYLTIKNNSGNSIQPLVKLVSSEIAYSEFSNNEIVGELIKVEEGSKLRSCLIQQNTSLGLGGVVQVSGGIVDSTFFLNNSGGTNGNFIAHTGSIINHLTFIGDTTQIGTSLLVNEGVKFTNNLILESPENLVINTSNSSFNAAYVAIGQNSVILNRDNLHEEGAQVILDTLLNVNSPCFYAGYRESHIGAYQGVGKNPVFHAVQDGNWHDANIWNYKTTPRSYSNVLIKGKKVLLDSFTKCNSVKIAQDESNSIGELYIEKGGFLRLNQSLEIEKQIGLAGDINKLHIKPGGMVLVDE
ncbi:MAG: fibronectin type III domain-containing protein, partial [Cyclobacteriaceae bacterium]|nr:fibronectin type III domain-containing protein [Cyclobacteriaceae bacterium HetDA_MAG_MS6]